MEIKYVPEAKIKTEIHVIIYKPENDIVETYKPQVIFAGKVLSMKALEQVSVSIRKALRNYKIVLGKELLNTESEVNKEGELSDGTE